MSRINTNTSSLTAQIRLNRTNNDLQTSLTRLSTGLRINSGKDDPAGLIASEALRSDITSINKALSNTNRATQIIATADSALGQVSSLLNDVRGLITEAANKGALSDDEIAANQLQIDSSLEAINRIAQTTTFQGRKLLDGSLDFQVAQGTGFANVKNLEINSANLGATGSITANVNITAAATKATKTIAFPSRAAPIAPATVPPAVTEGNLGADVVFQLTGANGTEVFKFQSGSTGEQVAAAINLLKDSTGVEAAYVNDTGTAGDAVLTLTSTEYGSDQSVAIEIISEGQYGLFTGAVGTTTRESGTDVVATVNGASTMGKGNTLSINNPTLSMKLDVAPAATGAIAFTINGGGAQFQLGPDVVSNQQARLGISSLNTAKLGGVNGRLYEIASDGNASLTKDVTKAAAIVDEVIGKVATIRGRLGAFQRTALESNTVSLNDTLTNLTEAQSSIRDADFAKESAALTRAQILVQSGTSVLGIANQSSQSVLSLLR